MTRSTCAVALVVPFLDAEDTLAEALDSVVAQTAFSRIRTILVDNASTDGSPAIAAAYAARHDGIEVLHRVGGGCGGARNTALDAAVEPYVAFLDADDVLPPRSIERRLDLIESSGADVVMGAIETFPDGGPYTPPALYAEDRVVPGLAAEPRLVQVPNVAGLLLPRSFFDDPAHRFLEDVPFEDVTVTTAALVEAGLIAVSSEVCSRYRKDPARTTIMTTAHVHPGNFRDVMTINELVHARHADDPVTTSIVGRLLVRRIRPFLLHAPGQLAPDDLRAFFDRARDLYRRYPLHEITEHLTRAAWSVAFYAVLADDLELFSDPTSHVTGVDVRADGAHLTLDRPVDPAYAALLRVHPLRRFDVGETVATLTSAEASPDGAIVLTGTVDSEGGSLRVPPRGFDFVLRIGTTAVTSPVEVSAADGPGPATWAAVVVTDRVPPGRHRLAFSSAAWSPRKRVSISTAAGVLRPSPSTTVGPNRAGTGSYVSVKPTSP